MKCNQRQKSSFRCAISHFCWRITLHCAVTIFYCRFTYHCISRVFQESKFKCQQTEPSRCRVHFVLTNVNRYKEIDVIGSLFYIWACFLISKSVGRIFDSLRQYRKWIKEPLIALFCISLKTHRKLSEKCINDWIVTFLYKYSEENLIRRTDSIVSNFWSF